MVGEFGPEPDVLWVDFELSRHKHRGPDNSEYLLVSSNVVMGANRLAMVDRLPRSNQPMQNPISKSALTFNGEIYNYQELRIELENEGIFFRTESDTEVLLSGLEKYGVNFLSRVNGMYAFVFFDAISSKLLLSRDRLGKKPLYIRRNEKGVRWSSTASSLWEDDAGINPEAIDCFLRFGYIIDPLTPKNGVSAISPGTILEVNIDTLMETLHVVAKKPEYKPKSFRELLIKSVESRTYPHDQIAISLSGGLDSTIVAIICKELGLNICSYTAIWTDSDKKSYNEDANRAGLIAKKLGIEHNEVEMISADEMPEHLREYVRIMEEPNNNPTGISMLNLYSKMKKDGIRLSLTGDGADELFGGYARYEIASHFPKLWNFSSDFWINSSHRKILRFAARATSSQMSQDNFSFWATWHEVFSRKELKKLTNQQGYRSDSNFFSEFRPKVCNTTVRILQEQDMLVWIGMESNRRLDRVSMNFSIEARSPFLDDELYDYAFGREVKGKFIPKSEFFKSEFPELQELPVLAEKKGFISPIGHWLRGNPAFVRNQMEQLIVQFGFKKDFIEELILSPSNGDFENIKKLWALLTLSVWTELNSSSARA
jgi:asparagine synthase (glutamine-hydrolysing)